MKKSKTSKIIKDSSQRTLHNFFTKPKDVLAGTKVSGCETKDIENSADRNVERCDESSGNGVFLKRPHAINREENCELNLEPYKSNNEISPSKPAAKRKCVNKLDKPIAENLFSSTNESILPVCGSSYSNMKSTIDEVNTSPTKINFVRTLLSPIKSNYNEDKKMSSVPLSLKENNIIEHNAIDDTGEMESDIANDMDNSIDFLFGDDWFEEENLQLNKFTYCTITGCRECSDGKFIDLKSFNKSNCTSSNGTCLLKGYWLHGSYEVNDVISIKGKYDESVKVWIVDDNYGYIVKCPDKLIPGTTIASTFVCLRRTVLNSICPLYEPPSSIMLIGSLIHELFEEVLKNNLKTLNEIQEIANSMARDGRILQLLYESDTPVSFLQKELSKFAFNIYQFVNIYCSKTDRNNFKNAWAGKIVDIGNVEENFWVPSLGIKGKVDVTVTAQTNCNSLKKLMPLELKTGKVRLSSEYRGQLMLYMLMMSELGENVDSGLLLFLRENVIEEIKMNRQECVGLLMLRNDLVSYLSKNETIESNFLLPESINDSFICSKCPNLTVCSMSLREEDFGKMSPNIAALMTSSVSHLSSSHISYFFHWLKLLKMEEKEHTKNPQSDISSIWHISPESRQIKGFSIGVYLDGNVCKQRGKLLHHMADKSSDGKINFTKQNFSCGDFVIISTDVRYALCLGTIANISESSIDLLLDRNLEPMRDMKFYIDLYTSATSVTSCISNVRLLLENTENAARLRCSIIDTQMPSFLATLDENTISVSSDLLEDLNIAQKRAVFRVLAADHYSLIKGMPGTGKTNTIVKLIECLVLLKKTVLVTSHTHSAVDNIFLRLRGKADFLRLGAPSKVHPDIRNYCDQTILTNSKVSAVEDIEALYNKPVVGITCMGSIRHVLLQKRVFDYCIVDEATQVLQPLTLAPLLAAKKFVLVGDPDQLPPIVLNKQASILGLEESLFKRLDTPAVTSLLHLQYRMNEPIMNLANSFAYNGLLKGGNDSVKTATIPVLNESVYAGHAWLRKALSNDINCSVIFINVHCYNSEEPKSTDEKYSIKYVNENEINVVVTIISALKQAGIDRLSIGVIAPYTNQIEAFKQKFLKDDILVEVSTVDQFQGRDKDIILYSCTRYTEVKEGDILNDKRRLTVAITRAKKKLIIIGNMSILQSYSNFKKLLINIPKDNIIDMPI